MTVPVAAHGVSPPVRPQEALCSLVPLRWGVYTIRAKPAPPAKAQRSGFGGKRRKHGVSELSARGRKRTIRNRFRRGASRASGCPPPRFAPMFRCKNRAEARTHFVGASCACSLPRSIAKALPLHCASSPNETRYRLVIVWLRTRKFNGGTNARK